ncbi:Segregation and condensation protein A [uncultured archaeon]|nr:Segregation and condensation protein A [uncultured archaeon]
MSKSKKKKAKKSIPISEKKQGEIVDKVISEQEPKIELPAQIESEVLPIEEAEFERDYSKMDLLDLIDQPAWKTILLDLVETEKMDPWNIDVVELAEKYLKKINELEGNNLRVPANAILACAILVKTKSKYLRLSSLDDEGKEKAVLTPEQRALMLQEIPDLLSNRMAREGRITLDELVTSIEDIIQRTTPKNKAARNIPRIEINFDSSSIEEKIKEVFDLIKQRADSQGIVLFKDLAGSSEVDAVVETFIPVLFLMNNGKILAYQNEFFGEIFVKLLEGVETVQEQ